MDSAQLDLLHDLQNNLADVVERVHQSLVHISNGRGVGAGTIWHSDGLIITNAHVVYGHHHLNVTLPDGRTLPTEVIASDKELDLAALSVNADDLPTIELGDSRLLKPGQWVMAVGHPWGVQGAITTGVVIGVSGDLPEMRTGREWVALDLHMRPGHSGGPLVDSAGLLVGINTMITGPDVGFAIPVQVVKNFLKSVLGTQKVAV
jgi:serine protease Do